MDGAQFDKIAKAVAGGRSRRAVLRGMVGGFLGGLLGPLAVEAAGGDGSGGGSAPAGGRRRHCRGDGRACLGDGQCCSGACDGQTHRCAPCPTGEVFCGGACAPLGTTTDCTACGDACEDGNACTADSCDPTSGCQHTPVADGTACETGGGVQGSCQGGTCVAQDCIPGGASCSDPLRCCSQVCNHGTGICGCSAVGGVGGLFNDCCDSGAGGGSCGNGVCCILPGSTGSCASDAECCTDSVTGAVGGVCNADHRCCLPTGGPCWDDGQCCGGSCGHTASGNVCQ